MDLTDVVQHGTKAQLVMIEFSIVLAIISVATATALGTDSAAVSATASSLFPS